MTINMVSIIVPIYNEEDNVAELHRQIVQSCQTLGKPYEIIFVDDGSSDRSLERMRQLTPLRIVEFERISDKQLLLMLDSKRQKGMYLSHWMEISKMILLIFLSYCKKWRKDMMLFLDGERREKINQ